MQHTSPHFKLLTIVANSSLSEAAKSVLDSYLRTLHASDANKLLGLFTTEPRALGLYAEYITELMQHETVTNQTIEEIMVRLLQKIE